MPPVEQQLLLASDQLISISQAAKLTPYSAEYLGLLARKGRLKAIKISRDWLTTREAVLSYVKQQAEKHKKLYRNLQQAQINVVYNSIPVRVRNRGAYKQALVPPSVQERGAV